MTIDKPNFDFNKIKGLGYVWLFSTFKTMYDRPSLVES